ncbi:hypothetical protein DW999_16940 [Ruminococcus sp. AM54-14NS]|nr:hypothetical protein DW999_16940 [Ruminococcus sp. AM54-14NS]
MTQKQNTLTKTGIVALLACVCCILWGSAIPVIKTGYRLMQVDSADTASQIVFAGGVAIIFYLAMVSAVAYTLWSVLLAWNDVSKVAIFGFVNPLCSVILSALMLGEVKQAFNIGSLIALILVCTGIYIVNCKKKMSR